MQKRRCWILSIITIIAMVILGTNLAFAGQSSIEFKDGTVIKGEIQTFTFFSYYLPQGHNGSSRSFSGQADLHKPVIGGSEPDTLSMLRPEVTSGGDNA